MKKIIIALVVFSFIGAACNKATDEKKTKAVDKASLQSDTDKLSYAIGLSIGKRLKIDNMQINTTIFSQGVGDGLSGQNESMKEEEVKEVIMAFQKKKMEERNKEAEDNLKKGEEFLAGKKNEEGVVALESGLLYKVITKGSGNTPGLKDSVNVNYRGTTIDGKEFDSSYKRDKPASFRVNRVIKGWTEALQLMKEGDKWELYIPSNLAYGPRGNKDIAPNATLIFEIELPNIEAKKEPAPGEQTATPPPVPGEVKAPVPAEAAPPQAAPKQ